ncbi:MAG: hypothetical protein IT445_00115 [Phycisphaeraceae bacterium]|nr:hypothetical protein [Phycisphaeraceae bacterium]
MKLSDNPNVLWHDLHDEARLMGRQSDSAVKAYRLARNHAYNAMQCYVALRDNHYDFLYQHVRTKYPDAQDPFDRYLDDLFASLLLFGDEWRELMQAVDAGMKFTQYMAGPACFPPNRTIRCRSISSCSRNAHCVSRCRMKYAN